MFQELMSNFFIENKDKNCYEYIRKDNKSTSPVYLGKFLEISDYTTAGNYGRGGYNIYKFENDKLNSEYDEYELTKYIFKIVPCVSKSESDKQINYHMKYLKYKNKYLELKKYIDSKIN
jgi:hypothetical protein